MDENRVWSMIETAWGSLGGKAKSRQRLAEGRLSADRAYALQESLAEEVVPALWEQLAALPADELLAFDRILERKLYVGLNRSAVEEIEECGLWALDFAAELSLALSWCPGYRRGCLLAPSARSRA